MNNKDKIKVYYSPVNLRFTSANWDILNYDPESVFDQVIKDYSKEKASFIMCPAVKQLLKNTFAIKNTLHSEYFIDNNEVKVKSKQAMFATIDHNPTIKNNTLLIMSYSYAFFTEEDSLEMELTSPYFENIEYTKYGCLVPGRYDIGSWYRPLNMEFNLWKNQNSFIIKEDETMAYVSFKTNKDVELIRYKMTDELIKILRVTSDAPTWSPKIPLVDRYKRFKKSRMKDIVLKEIKNNVF